MVKLSCPSRPTPPPPFPTLSQFQREFSANRKGRKEPVLRQRKPTFFALISFLAVFSFPHPHCRKFSNDVNSTNFWRKPENRKPGLKPALTEIGQIKQSIFDCYTCVCNVVNSDRISKFIEKWKFYKT